MAGSAPGRGRVLIVEPMSGGLGLISAAHECGFEVVVASSETDDRVLPTAVRHHIDTLLVVDTNDESALTQRVLEFHARRPLHAILPGFEFYVDTTARLADRLGLSGLPVATVAGLRDKAVMRARMRAAGLRVPRYAEADNAADLAAAAQHVGFPAVLKPTTSAGSVHVSRVDDADQLARAYRWLLADDRTDLGRRLDGRVLLEEYIDGPEVSVEGYVADGRVTVVSVTTKMLGPEPHFVEIGHIVQRDMDPVAREAVESYVAAVCRALGVTMGPFHCELRLPDDEPVLIEIGGRLPGGHIVDLVRMVTGVSLPLATVAIYTGLGLDEAGAVGNPQAKCAALLGFTATGGSTLRAVEGIDALRDSADVLELELTVRPGDELPPADDFRGRIGHVIFHADSYAAALDRWHAIQQEVRFV